MALLDVFKKEKERKPKGPKLEPIEAEKKETKEIKIKPVIASKKTTAQDHTVLISPHVTEKASDLGEKNKYTFKVSKRSNKTSIKKAIENIYNVKVVGVAVINVVRKKRKRGRQIGYKTGYKKAIIEVKKGQKIEVLPK